MASSSLSELLRNGDKTKVRIGCRDQMDAYAEVLQKMGSVYGDVEVADYESIEVAEIKAKEASNGLGNFNLASDVADMDGLFESNQMAAVEIRPMLDFTFTKDQQVKATAFSLRQLAGGRTIEGRLLSVPSPFPARPAAQKCRSRVTVRVRLSAVARSLCCSDSLSLSLWGWARVLKWGRGCGV